MTEKQFKKCSKIPVMIEAFQTDEEIEISTFQIGGVKYVPVTEVENIQVEKIREVLKSQKYLSQSAIDEIIDALSHKEKSSKHSPKSDSQFEYNSIHMAKFRIGRVMSNGSVEYKTRKSPAKWNIHHAIMIRNSMNKDSSKGMTYSDVLKMEKKIDLSQSIIRKIMYNIEHGDLIKWIDEWMMKYNQKRIDGFKPVENNPQKRKESVLYV